MKLPSRVLFAVAAVAAVAAAVFTASVCLVPAQLSARTLLLAALCGALVLLARRFPIHITEKTKTSVATAPLFAAALLLPLPVALAITSFASAGAEAWRRSRWFQAVFNIGSGALQVAAGGAALALMGGGARASLQPSGWLPGAVAGAAVFDGAGALLVELMVSVQLQRLVLRQFWQRVWLSLPQEALLLLLGLLLALAALHAPWALPLLVAPVALVYRSLKVMAGGRPPDAVAKTPAHLAQLPRRLQLFIVATGIAATLGSLAVSSRSGGGWTLHSALLAAATAGFAAAAYRLPVKPAPRRTLVLDASFMVVAIAALPSTPALVSIATASLLGNVMLRRPWFNTLFNAAQRTLAGLGGILVMHALVRTPLTNGVTVRAALALATAAVVYWLISTALVDLIGAVQLRRNPFAHWFSAHEQSLLAHLLLLPAG
ncbi:MAG TPA: hypothetical protein VFA70_03845, partial [Dehalococcoidia bacterium]|nr:hypothetical protein [Dehalococcoidia bacterium]